MYKKQGLIALSVMLLPLVVVGAMSVTEVEEGKKNPSYNCKNVAEGCKPINGTVTSVTYIKTTHSKEHDKTLKAAEKGCETYRELKLPGAGAFKVLGPKQELDKWTDEEYYSHDGHFYAKYRSGYIAVPENACKFNIVSYQENVFSDYVKLVSYKYRAVTSKKEKWSKTKLLDVDAAALAVDGLESKMGLADGVLLGEDAVAKVPCTVSKLNHQEFEVTTCQWKKDIKNGHAQLPNALILRSETKWKSGKVSKSIAEIVDFNKSIEDDMLKPPLNILNKKFPVDEINTPEND